MEISKAYEPQAVEEKWYDFWLKQNCFTANPASPKPAYSIVIPPPNVTGVLHMGHVLNNTIQDILSRKARMDGKEVLWLPGTDHAGIATQVMVERQIKKTEHKTRHDLGREEFLKRVWAWKEKHGDIIIQQLKKLGCSCDWTRERFTMDPEYSRCVQKVFVELYKKGLIYRGKRMVNWCPATLTALSDEEVDMEPQKGSLWYFKVEVVDKVGQASSLSVRPTGDWLTIATTRPETIPGDTGVAVNPKDPRYAQLIGKFVIRPLPPELPLEKKLIPIVADEHIDIEFGTGVLKVTPAHDKADFEIGQRHGLPAVDIMNPDASMNELAGEDLAGLDRFEARAKASELLRTMGALVKEEPYENKVGFSQRAKVPIEPRLSEQWFLKYPAVEQSKACVEQEEKVGLGQEKAGLAQQEEKVGLAVPSEPPRRVEDNAPYHKMRFHPQRWAKVYDHWLSNIQDWCISRQLWWGHRIPVWTKRGSREQIEQIVTPGVFAGFIRGEESQITPTSKSKATIHIALRAEIMYRSPQADVSNVEVVTYHVSRLSDDEFSVEAAAYTDEGVAWLRERGFTQDPDVLDTWFSSWLWPFATMRWTGDKSQDASNPTLQKFYPTTDLVTGPDIIFFWVARMIMAGYEFMGDLPFRNVYFTGIIRDKQGRKMSKTLGNSPDPLELIAKYGADALRFGTMRSAPLGQDVLFDEKDVELGRNFCNKLWNACRFRQMVGQASSLPSEVQGEINPQLLTTDDKWILLKLDQAIREISDAFEEYNFSTAVQTLYRFFWSEYCDWYVEASKAVLNQSTAGSSASPSGTSPAHAAPSPSPLGGERVGVRGEAQASQSPIANRQTPTENEARRANKLAVIDFVLSHTLRLFHPFLPFITEELWHGMGYAEDMPENQGGKTIMFAPWPKPLDDNFKGHYGLDDCYLEMVDAKYDLVTQGRNLRRTANIPASKKVKFIFKPVNHTPPQELEVIRLLLNAEAVEVNAAYQPPKGTPAVRTSLGELCLPLEGVVDTAAEKARLTKELQKIETEIAKVEQKLANPNFVQKVPPQVLQEHQQRLADWHAKRDHVRTALDSLNGSG